MVVDVELHCQGYTVHMYHSESMGTAKERYHSLVPRPSRVHRETCEAWIRGWQLNVNGVAILTNVVFLFHILTVHGWSVWSGFH